MSDQLLADIVAAIHVGYVACVVFGLLLILAGRWLGWNWVSNRWFRLAHLAMIVGVVLRAIVWTECPLTWWERDLRGGFAPENFVGAPVGKFLHDLIHPEFPHWVFFTVYAAFALLVIAAFWVAPVNWRPAPPRPADAAP